MFWLPLVCSLVLWCTGSHSQTTLTQPPSASVAPGNTVKFSCTISSASSVNRYFASWYQQKPGSPPRYLLQYYSNSSKHQGSGVPTRFSGSKDNSGLTAYLTITSVLAEDEANYYCLTYHSDMSVFGGGTYLSVTDQPAVSPLVNLFPPSKEQMETKNEATLACLIDGFTPRTISVQWTADGSNISDGVETSTAVKQSDNNGYLASSYLTLSLTKWQSHQEIGCKVTHEGKLIEKTVRRSDVPS